MTFERMLQKHEKELADFYQEQRLAWRKLLEQKEITFREIEAFQKEWTEKYKKLVSKTYNEAQRVLSQEQKERAEKRKLDKIIDDSKENSDWLEEGEEKKQQETEHEKYTFSDDEKEAEQEKKFLERIKNLRNKGRSITD